MQSLHDNEISLAWNVLDSLLLARYTRRENKPQERFVFKMSAGEILVQLRTVLVSEGHDVIHVIRVVHNESRQIFDVHSDIRALFDLQANEDLRSTIWVPVFNKPPSVHFDPCPADLGLLHCKFQDMKPEPETLKKQNTWRI
jgi:hypothetical protein